MSKAYYNEFDSGAAAWLRELIRMGAIADGDVDERSIEDVYPSDLRGYTQCHFFAGIGGWSYALRLAGWPDDRPVWTGSCPCQPFSSAGKGAGQKDIRHLWPVWIKLISACQPDIIFGEQVSSALVLGKATNESLQNLRAEFTGSGILQAYRGDSASILQGLSSYSRQGALRGIGQGGDHGKISPVQGNTEDYAAGELPDYRSKTARQEERHTLQLGRSQSGNSRGDKRRGVPVIRDLFQFDGEASMEQPIVGQNNPGTGIYTGECSSSFVFSERHDARLGAGDGSSGNGGVVKKQGVKNDESRVSGAADAQDDGATGGAWIDLVQADMEGLDYAFGAVPFPSAGVGAPHLRDRLYWVGDAAGFRRNEQRGAQGVALQGQCAERSGTHAEPQLSGKLSRGFEGLGGVGRLDDAEQYAGRCKTESTDNGGSQADRSADQRGGCSCSSGGMDNALGIGWGARRHDDTQYDGQQFDAARNADRPGPTNGFWRDADWLYCRDGKWRPVEPGTFPLVDGLPSGVVPSSRIGMEIDANKTAEARVMRLRGYGNAINPVQASMFVEVFMESIK